MSAAGAIEAATSARIYDCWRFDACRPWFTSPATSRRAAPSKAVSVALVSVTRAWRSRSEEHTSELQSLMRISYAVFCLKKKKKHKSIKQSKKTLKYKINNTQ